MQTQQPPSTHPLRDAMSTEAKHAQLPPAHNAPLPPGNPLQPG
jgi:hypothetical protein